MTSDRHLDPVASAQSTRNLPMRWRLWFAAGIVLAFYVFFVGMHWARQVDSIPDGLSTLAGVAITTLALGGCIDVALNRMDALARLLGELKERMEALTALGRLATIVEANTAAIRRLESARTIDLHNRVEAEEKLEGLIRTLTTEAIADLTKEIRGYGEVVDDLKAALGVIRHGVAVVDTKQDALTKDLADARGAMKTAVEEAYMDGFVDGASDPGRIHVLGARRPHPPNPMIDTRNS